MSNLLKNKVAIITGAASGIGKGIALEMANEGAKIVIADINAEESNNTLSLISKRNGEGFVVITDVSRIAQNEDLLKVTLQKFGRVDVLINNAGIGLGEGFLNVTQADLMSTINTNFIGPFLLTQSVVKHMVSVNTKGSVIFTSSIHAHITMQHPVYTASKAAIEMFVRDIALEMAPYGIRINAVSPGAIAIKDEQDRTNNQIPIGYSGSPQDVANLATFLASDKASYITGQSIIVDGGFSLAHYRFWHDKKLI